jgi:proline racemase
VQSPLPVIRSYTGIDRTAAEAAYRGDVRNARAAGWVPVAHRWRRDGDQHELSVVFELHEPEAVTVTAGTPEVTQVTENIEAPLTDAPDASPGEPAGRDEGLGDTALGETGSAPPTIGPAATGVSTARAHARATLETIDLHAGGEPIRLIRSGYPQVPFASILDRRRWAREHADSARQMLMYEPRGHRDMYGAVLLPPFRSDADIAVLFMHNEGYSTMCGHGVIALTTGLIEEGLYPAGMPATTIRWETPAGLVTAVATVGSCEDGGPEVSSVRFTNVPSYLHDPDIAVPVEGRGPVQVQLAFGGAYYGIVDAADLGLRVVPASIDALTSAGAAITRELRKHHSPTHPIDADLGFVYGTIIVDHEPATSPDGRATDATIRNVTVFADAEVDRSPCGSGTSALLAWLYAAGRLEQGQDIRNASITGEVFEGRVESLATLGARDAVITSVAGSGYVTGYHTFVVDDRDPLGDGFLLR